MSCRARDAHRVGCRDSGLPRLASGNGLCRTMVESARPVGDGHCGENIGGRRRHAVFVRVGFTAVGSVSAVLDGDVRRRGGILVEPASIRVLEGSQNGLGDRGGHGPLPRLSGRRVGLAFQEPRYGRHAHPRTGPAARPAHWRQQPRRTDAGAALCEGSLVLSGRFRARCQTAGAGHRVAARAGRRPIVERGAAVLQSRPRQPAARVGHRLDRRVGRHGPSG